MIQFETFESAFTGNEQVEEGYIPMNGLKIVFTGFRSSELEDKIKSRGGAVTTSVNKNTSYAHMHKGQMHGRMYKWTDVQPSYDYSYNYWIHQKRDFFEGIVDRFGPFPNWKPDWKKRFYGCS